ncbi:hypothetical protein CEUSTIGMA_g7967.t1 [Chlamydomonas eustigma]|uniref:Uncharacterized protein n=1 Tax=Chlamydomonas eustigma TaxID=1157962 RepID=A0A250XCB6_9CHLO|nr:hypothetical protein CEUSTIGMA_g7967.t1 [Chlamydomonas eustigma]|eukprot:GAX80529.1 hypothetical protein CEUSTIGMA_g7967.t1 [Chlamydomonas eustigma]
MKETMSKQGIFDASIVTEVSNNLIKLFHLYCRPNGEIVPINNAEPKMSQSQLVRICQDLGIMAPSGPLPQHIIHVIHSSYKPIGSNGLSFPQFKLAMEAAARGAHWSHDDIVDAFEHLAEKSLKYEHKVFLPHSSLRASPPTDLPNIRAAALSRGKTPVTVLSMMERSAAFSPPTPSDQQLSSTPQPKNRLFDMIPPRPAIPRWSQDEVYKAKPSTSPPRTTRVSSQPQDFEIQHPGRPSQPQDFEIQHPGRPSTALGGTTALSTMAHPMTAPSGATRGGRDDRLSGERHHHSAAGHSVKGGSRKSTPPAAHRKSDTAGISMIGSAWEAQGFGDFMTVDEEKPLDMEDPWIPSWASALLSRISCLEEKHEQVPKKQAENADELIARVLILERRLLGLESSRIEATDRAQQLEDQLEEQRRHQQQLQAQLLQQSNLARITANDHASSLNAMSVTLSNKLAAAVAGLSKQRDADLDEAAERQQGLVEEIQASVNALDERFASEISALNVSLSKVSVVTDHAFDWIPKAEVKMKQALDVAKESLSVASSTQGNLDSLGEMCSGLSASFKSLEMKTASTSSNLASKGAAMAVRMESAETRLLKLETVDPAHSPSLLLSRIEATEQTLKNLEFTAAVSTNHKGSSMKVPDQMVKRINAAHNMAEDNRKEMASLKVQLADVLAPSSPKKGKTGSKASDSAKSAQDAATETSAASAASATPPTTSKGEQEPASTSLAEENAVSLKKINVLKDRLETLASSSSSTESKLVQLTGKVEELERSQLQQQQQVPYKPLSPHCSGSLQLSGSPTRESLIKAQLEALEASSDHMRLDFYVMADAAKDMRGQIQRLSARVDAIESKPAERITTEEDKNVSEVRVMVKEVVEQVQGALIKEAFDQVQGSLIKEVVEQVQGSLVKEVFDQVQGSLIKEVVDKVQTSMVKEVVDQVQGSQMKDVVDKLQLLVGRVDIFEAVNPGLLQEQQRLAVALLQLTDNVHDIKRLIDEKKKVQASTLPAAEVTRSEESVNTAPTSSKEVAISMQNLQDSLNVLEASTSQSAFALNARTEEVTTAVAQQGEYLSQLAEQVHTLFAQLGVAQPHPESGGISVEVSSHEVMHRLTALENQLPGLQQQQLEDLIQQVQALTSDLHRLELAQSRSALNSAGSMRSETMTGASVNRSLFSRSDQLKQLEELKAKVQALDAIQYTMPQEISNLEKRLKEQLALQQQSAGSSQLPRIGSGRGSGASDPQDIEAQIFKKLQEGQLQQNSAREQAVKELKSSLDQQRKLLEGLQRQGSERQYEMEDMKQGHEQQRAAVDTLSRSVEKSLKGLEAKVLAIEKDRSTSVKLDTHNITDLKAEIEAFKKESTAWHQEVVQGLRTVQQLQAGYATVQGLSALDLKLDKQEEKLKDLQIEVLQGGGKSGIDGIAKGTFITPDNLAEALQEVYREVGARLSNMIEETKLQQEGASRAVTAEALTAMPDSSNWLQVSDRIEGFAAETETLKKLLSQLTDQLTDLKKDVSEIQNAPPQLAAPPTPSLSSSQTRKAVEAMQANMNLAKKASSRVASRAISTFGSLEGSDEETTTDPDGQPGIHSLLAVAARRVQDQSEGSKSKREIVQQLDLLQEDMEEVKKREQQVTFLSRRLDDMAAGLLVLAEKLDGRVTKLEKRIRRVTGKQGISRASSQTEDMSEENLETAAHPAPKTLEDKIDTLFSMLQGDLPRPQNITRSHYDLLTSVPDPTPSTDAQQTGISAEAGMARSNARAKSAMRKNSTLTSIPGSDAPLNPGDLFSRIANSTTGRRVKLDVEDSPVATPLSPAPVGGEPSFAAASNRRGSLSYQVDEQRQMQNFIKTQTQVAPMSRSRSKSYLAVAPAAASGSLKYQADGSASSPGDGGGPSFFKEHTPALRKISMNPYDMRNLQSFSKVSEPQLSPTGRVSTSSGLGSHHTSTSGPGSNQGSFKQHSDSGSITGSLKSQVSMGNLSKGSQSFGVTGGSGVAMSKSFSVAKSRDTPEAGSTTSAAAVPTRMSQQPIPRSSFNNFTSNSGKAQVPSIQKSNLSSSSVEIAAGGARKQLSFSVDVALGEA